MRESMARHCPKCNFLNPYGAQICGECGHPLMAAKTPRPKRETKHGRLPATIRWKAIGLQKMNQGVGRRLLQVMATGLFLYGVAVLVLSIAKWFKPAHGLQFILHPAHMYPLLLGLFFGAFTLLLAFGCYFRKPWAGIWYFIWVGTQVALLLILALGWWRPEWLTPRGHFIFGFIILIELILVPFVARLQRRSTAQ